MQGRNITSTTAHCGAHTGKDILMLAGELMFSQYQAHTQKPWYLQLAVL